MTPLLDGFRTTINDGTADLVDLSATGLINGSTVLAYVRNFSGFTQTIELAIVPAFLSQVPFVKITVTIPQPSQVLDRLPDVTALADGRFVVSWQSNLPGGQDVVAQIFNPDGTKVGGLITVASAVDVETDAVVAPDAIGGFAVSWKSAAGNGDIISARFNSAGVPLLNSGDLATGTNVQQQPAASTSTGSSGGTGNDGTFVVWTETISGSSVIRGSILRLFGDPEAPATLTAPGGGNETDASVAELTDHRFIVTFTGDAGQIIGRFVDKDGQPLGSVFGLSTGTTGQTESSVVALLDGRFAVAWRNSSNADITLQIFDRNGDADGDEISVNDAAANVAGKFDISLLADGRLSVTWQELFNGHTAVRNQIYDPRELGTTIAGSRLADQLVGTIFADTINGRDGNDTIQARGGDDTIFGGAGNDSIGGDLGNDTLDGGDGNDTLFSGGGEDIVTGGAGNDDINGGGGSDRMVGGVGNDTYEVEDLADVVIELLNQGIDSIQTNFLSIDLNRFANVENAKIDGSASDNLSLKGNALNNVLSGDSGNNLIQGNNGNDTLLGSDGLDTLQGGAGNDVLNGEGDADTMAGGLGNDTFFIVEAGDVVIELANQGTDTIRTARSLTLGANVENAIALATVNITGNGLNNVLTGNGGINIINGAAGNDFVRGGGGNDQLLGISGNDILQGDLGADQLFGGAGLDRFAFRLVTDSTVATAGRDVVRDFVKGQDKIDLSALDANAALAGNQAFAFVGAAGFGGLGKVRAFQSAGHTFVDVNITGNAAPEMRIEIAKLVTLAAIDFIL